MKKMKKKFQGFFYCLLSSNKAHEIVVVTVTDPSLLVYAFVFNNKKIGYYFVYIRIYVCIHAFVHTGEREREREIICCT